MFQSAALHFSTKIDGFCINDSTNLKRLIKGAGKINQSKTRTLLPFTKQHLRAFISTSRANDCLCYWRVTASCIMAFFGFLRISEVVTMRMSDLCFEFFTIKLKIKRAKRHPSGFDAVIARDNEFSNFVEEFWTKYKINYDSNFPCFPQINGTKFKPIAATTIQQDLKKIMKLLNMPISQYAFHSCKLGGTTKASEKGISKSEILALGHWKSSSMVDRYTRTTSKRLSELSQRLCENSFTMKK